MFKKTLTGIIVILTISGTFYSINQKINNLKLKNTQLEIKIKQLENELNKQTKELKNTKNLLNTKTEELNKLKQKKEELTKKLGKAQEFTLTFYTTLPQENGGYTVTCTGQKLKNGMVASNVYPLGTKIRINGKIFTVADRGGKNFNNSNRLDVLVERNPGESDNDYLKRVNNLGTINVIGYILED